MRVRKKTTIEREKQTVPARCCLFLCFIRARGRKILKKRQKRYNHKNDTRTYTDMGFLVPETSFFPFLDDNVRARKKITVAAATAIVWPIRVCVRVSRLCFVSFSTHRQVFYTNHTQIEKQTNKNYMPRLVDKKETREAKKNKLGSKLTYTTRLARYRSLQLKRGKQQTNTRNQRLSSLTS